MKIANMNRAQVVTEIERAAGGLGSRHHVALLVAESRLRVEEPTRLARRRAAEKVAGRKAKKQAKIRKRRAALTG